MDGYIKMGDVLGKLGVSKPTLYKLINERDVTRYRIPGNRETYLREQDVLVMLTPVPRAKAQAKEQTPVAQAPARKTATRARTPRKPSDTTPRAPVARGASVARKAPASTKAPARKAPEGTKAPARNTRTRSAPPGTTSGRTGRRTTV
jgi:hypothetical protein